MAVDGWGRKLRDEYYFEGTKLRLNIRSAGVDGRFETRDDIMQ